MLPTDLAYTIISYFGLIKLQKYIIYGNIVINKNQLYLFILNNYGLSPIEIERDYTNPIRLKQLTSSQSFVKVLTYLGRLGYDQQNYVSSDILLLLSIKNKNLNLINYYLPMFNKTGFNNIFLLQAILTNDINIIRPIENSPFTNNHGLTSTSPIQAWLKYSSINDYTVIDPDFVNNSIKVKFVFDIDVYGSSVSFYPVNSYFNLPLDPGALNAFALYSIQPDLLRFTKNNKLIGIDNFIKVDVISEDNLITTDLIDKIDDMRLLILQIPPSSTRDYYLLQLDVLQGKEIDLTSNLIEDNVIILMLSVLHPQIVILSSNADFDFGNFANYIKNSEVIYNPIGFLPLLASLGLDINDNKIQPIWQSIWLANLQWLAVVGQPLP